MSCWTFLNQVAATETKSCGLWYDSRQDFPFVNLLEFEGRDYFVSAAPLLQ